MQLKVLQPDVYKRQAKARTEVSAASQAVAAKKAEYLAAKELEKQRLAELMSIGATGSAKPVSYTHLV